MGEHLNELWRILGLKPGEDYLPDRNPPLLTDAGASKIREAECNPPTPATPNAGEDRKQLDHLWLNEMRLAGRLKHPYILEIYEAGAEGGHSFLVMEYLSGGSLASFTSPGTLLPPSRVPDVVFKVCHAQEYANTQGLLHRDVKPANVLLAADGTPKVSDFGAAYLLGEEHTQVMGVGTLAFMPPEHFEGAEPSVQHDIYATGIMAYHLLCGSYPHRAETQANLIHEKLHPTGPGTPGPAVPLPFDGNLSTVLCQVDETTSVPFVVVLEAAKMAAPFVGLIGTATVLERKAKIGIFGHDLTDNPVTATGYLTIYFADYQVVPAPGKK